MNVSVKPKTIIIFFDIPLTRDTISTALLFIILQKFVFLLV